MPEHCPSCGAALVEQGPYTVCPNGFKCPAQLAGRIQHLAWRDALDIEGLGEETAKQLVAEGLVRQLPDIFTLTVEQLVLLDGFADKSAENLIQAIARAKTGAELGRFLFALGIPEVGAAVARDLARHFGSFDALRRASSEDLQAVHGIGPRMAEQISGFFADQENRAILDRLLRHVRLAAPAQPTTRVLDGMKIVFTGALTRLKRHEAKELVERLGGRAMSSVSKATDLVVYGEDAGSKLDDARRLGVQLATEEAFLATLHKKGVDL
jgi:DNA ligase (NAD+)